MKFNWGIGIGIFYSLFVVAMVSMVVKSTYNRAQMVQDDYYALDLNYEDFRQKRQNGSKLGEGISAKYLPLEQLVQLKFPEGMQNAIGKVTLFRPSSQSMDQHFPIVLNERGEMQIPITKDVRKGLWVIQLDWEHQSRAYYYEKNIII